ncbi:MAG: hypothetical protein PHV30_04400 [Candidatus Margulisbacteria bacterium]|nr:hypothetical protein [Candidatus Margulisiibacteriota bacterium]
MKAFELAKEIDFHKLSFRIYPPLWEMLDLQHFGITESDCREIKYLNDTADAFHADINNLPSNSGGIYFFIVKNPKIPFVHSFLLYIGRSRITSNANLRKRCKSYFQKHQNATEERPYITRIFNQWAKFLYIKYICISNNDATESLEKVLINSILPPFNNEIPDKRISAAVRAFS